MLATQLRHTYQLLQYLLYYPKTGAESGKPLLWFTIQHSYYYAFTAVGQQNAGAGWHLPYHKYTKPPMQKLFVAKVANNLKA